MTECKHTPGPWKAVTTPNFGNGYIYTSIQPVTVDPESMTHLAMANGEYHVCRMTHTATRHKAELHRANAAFIVRACNSHDELLDVLKATLSDFAAWSEIRGGIGTYGQAMDRIASAIAKAEGPAHD